MIQFFKKHYILTAFLLMPLVCYIYLYFTKYRYDDDMRDFRHYPIPPLTEKWTKTIEYKTLPNVKYSKCFMLTFNSNKLSSNVNKMFGENFVSRTFAYGEYVVETTYYDYVYRLKYELFNTEDLTDEEFYKEAKEKPHFWLKIYQDDVLLETRELYFTNIKTYGSLKIENKEFFTTSIIGRPGHKQGYCHDFEEGIQYKLEIINDQIIPEFHDVEVFFTIRPYTPKA